MCAGNILTGVLDRSVDIPIAPDIGGTRTAFLAIQWFETGALCRIELSLALRVS